MIVTVEHGLHAIGALSQDCPAFDPLYILPQ